MRLPEEVAQARSFAGRRPARWKRWVTPALFRIRPYLPFVLVLAVVAPAYDSLTALDPLLLAAAFRGLRPEWLAVASVLTALNIAVMGAYDIIAFRHTRAAWPRRWFNGAIAFVWSNFLTFGPVAGPAVRFWLYRGWVDEPASLRDGVVLVSVAFGSGLAGWGVGVWLMGYVPPALQAFALPLVAFACSLVATFAVVRVLRSLRTVGSDCSNKSALAMAALGWLDWGLAWATFAACLLAADAGAAIPGSGSAFFLGQTLGLASLVPGGFGGGDAYWILHLAGPAPPIVCALISYRVLYYVLPWALGSLAVLSSAASFARHTISLPATDPAR